MKKVYFMVFVALFFATGALMVFPKSTVAATGAPQCSDSIDNDGDGLADFDDPQCHIDGNALNIDSYDPTIEQEADTAGKCVSCGPVATGGGGGGGAPSYICSDGKDNDGDGLIDGMDPGCHLDNDLTKPYNPTDLDETNPAVEKPKPTVLGESTTACGTVRPCLLQKTGGMTPARIKANREALVVAQQEKNSIVIPALKINKSILQLPTIDALRTEFWVLPWTSTPDKGGNTVLVAHSYNLVKGKYSKSTLYNLETMKKGDTITITWKGSVYTYEVSEVLTKVSPDTISIEDQTDTPTLTIYGCGRYDNTYRNVVKAVLKK